MYRFCSLILSLAIVMALCLNVSAQSDSISIIPTDAHLDRLDSIIKARQNHPQDFTHEDLDEMNVFGGTSQKDIIVSYVEGQIVEWSAEAL